MINPKNYNKKLIKKLQKVSNTGKISGRKFRKNTLVVWAAEFGELKENIMWWRFVFFVLLLGIIGT